MKTFNYLLRGLGIGFIITTVSLLVFVGVNELTKQLFAWLVASAIYGLTSVIFESKNLNLLSCTIIHFFICLSITMINIFLFYRAYLVIVLVEFVVIYSLIYVVMWLIDRNKIKKINQRLKEK